ncbi:Protein of unknown function [Modestobacter sp. DSM 44400]|uniref:DUF3152 domain-containing protein n=1 Tax=Modestobacter sp. DSM 44400 TaxID=1550230 RepID=UPI000896A8CD|nr:DUF3152 domain-containing protein [Modestobacter sp. DSM 44400]SDX48253.1 Protein of unknown function [Modestobacter sp. DSM 44400]
MTPRESLTGVPRPDRAADPRGSSRPGQPLVASRDPVGRGRQGAHDLPTGRVRRFVHRYGWRAYAIPVLTAATLVALVDVAATNAQDTAGRADTAAAAQPAVPSTTAPVPTALATTADPQVAEGEGRPTAEVTVGPSAPTFVEQGAGTVTVVDGTSPVLGSGPLERFVVEVEDGVGVDDAGFADAVVATLGDARSWGSGGQMSFQRVGAAEAAAGSYDFRVSLVSPASMETYCPGVGTGGYTSCRYGERAVINLARWETAVPDYAGDIATYRQYVVNHEVGHALGHGHEQCSGPGRVAPVMEQQTLGLQGCTKNAWPYP